MDRYKIHVFVDVSLQNMQEKVGKIQNKKIIIVTGDLANPPNIIFLKGLEEGSWAKHRKGEGHRKKSYTNFLALFQKSLYNV
jgi:hypothetical protein